MPELPEVETVCRALAPVLEQHHVAAAFVGREDLRWPLPENLIHPCRPPRKICVDSPGSTKYFVAASWHVRVYSHL